MIDAKKFHKVIMYMANRWSREESIRIFGNVMGEHFWDKWYSGDHPDLGTMRLFYQMDFSYMQKMFDYIEENYHGE